MRGLGLSLATAVAIVVVAATGFDRYSKRHFLPEQRMVNSVGQSGCILVLGDSRMEAGLDPDALRSSLRQAGRDRCVAPLVLGAIDVAGLAVTAREHLRRGGAPSLVVVGKVGDSLLGPAVPVRPEGRTGNNAIHFTWTSASDVFDEVPGFPFGDVGALDAGLRFLTTRATPLGQYQSLVSARVQALGARLTGTAAGERNRFGALGDMADLERDLRARAPARLAAVLNAPAGERMGFWFGTLVGLLQARRIPFVVVELPMRREYMDAVTNKPEFEAYERWLEGALSARGGQLVDLSRGPWADEALFTDDLHLGTQGATLFSTELGRRLATLPALTPPL